MIEQSGLDIDDIKERCAALLDPLIDTHIRLANARRKLGLPEDGVQREIEAAQGVFRKVQELRANRTTPTP